MSNLRRLLMRHASSGISLVVPLRRANCEIGDTLLYDRNMDRLCILKSSRFTKAQIEALDTTRYYNTKALYFGKEVYENDGVITSYKSLWLSNDVASRQWAINNFYKLTFPTATNGVVPSGTSFTITIKVADETAATTATIAVSLDSDTSIADIANTIRSGKATQISSSYRGYAVVGLYQENGQTVGIGIKTQGWSNNSVAISNVSTREVEGVTKADASLYDYSTRVTFDGTITGSTTLHRSVQGSYVNSLFSGTTGFKWPGNVAQNYARNGHNLGYWAGGNFAKFKSYAKTANNTTVVDDSDGATAPMNYATWQSITGPESASFSIYSNYLSYYRDQDSAPQSGWISMYGTPTVSEIEGPYDLYIMSRMMNTEWMNQNASGMINLFYKPTDPTYAHDGITGTTSLAKLAWEKGLAGGADNNTTPFTETSTVYCYPAARYCYTYEPTGLPTGSTEAAKLSAGHWNLSTGYQTALFMRDDIYKLLNSTWDSSGKGISPGTSISNTSYYWSLSESRNSQAWFYNSGYGRFDYNYGKLYAADCRPVLALDLPS